MHIIQSSHKLLEITIYAKGSLNQCGDSSRLLFMCPSIADIDMQIYWVTSLYFIACINVANNELKRAI